MLQIPSLTIQDDKPASPTTTIWIRSSKCYRKQLVVEGFLISDSDDDQSLSKKKNFHIKISCLSFLFKFSTNLRILIIS